VKAVAIRQADKPIPTPGADDVLIHAKSFGLNRSEVHTAIEKHERDAAAARLASFEDLCLKDWSLASAA
jgi:NADPH:quinone reductase-like Zn-dependent oxidoreductase